MTDIRLVRPDDPFGRSGRHRSVRIVLQSPDSLHPICWFQRMLDGSVSFGFRQVSTATIIGKATINDAGHIAPLATEVLDQMPLERRKSPHVTLHPSGICHYRSGVHEPIFEYMLADWYPVQRSFDWMHVHTNPVERIAAVAQRRVGDAIVPFPDQRQSAYLRVDILPPISKDNPGIERRLNAIDNIISLGPDYTLRVAVYPHPPIEGQILIATVVS